MILATENEIIKQYFKEGIDNPKKVHKYLEALSLRKKELSSARISEIIDMPQGTINHWFYGKTPKSIKGINELKSMGLLPLKISNNLAFQQFIITLGFRYADGCIYRQKRNKSFTLYLCFKDRIDALKFCEDAKKAWNINLIPHFNGKMYNIYLPASLSRLMIAVGSPCGNKNYQNFKLPKWIFTLNKELKWKFIDGFFSGDGESPKLKKSENSCESLKLSLNTEENIVKKFCSGFMWDIKNLINNLGIKVTKPKIDWKHPLVSKEGIRTYSITIRILTQKENMIKFLENIHYTYRKRAKIQIVLDALKYKNRIRELKDYIKSSNLKLNPPKICVLLKRDLQRDLIINAANKVSKIKWGMYKNLAVYLKARCKTFTSIKTDSIFDNYIPNWKKKEKFIPIDCALELFKLNGLKPIDLKRNIERLKILKTHNKYAVLFC